MNLVVPRRLKTLLSKNESLSAGVWGSLAVFDKWLGDFTKGLPFFAGYTDHGPIHISRVLASADALIAKKAFKELNPADAAALILSVVLHDSAMHISDDGFKSLVRTDSANRASPSLDTKGWPELWLEYISHARVWTERYIEDIFGQIQSSRPGETSLIRQPPSDSALWDSFDRAFIGEFLRRHHPRLAHEIALFGVPGPLPEDKRMRLTGVDDDLANLSGLIARSHGLVLRHMMDFLSEKSAFIEEVHGVKAVYLMGLLRIADYLEMDASRAPAELDKIRSLRSPFSRGEWRRHQSISVSKAHPDPEAVFVNVKPPDVHTYLLATKLLSDIQSELDMTWAVFGELYQSKQRTSWKAMTINLRRIRSNLESMNKFDSTVAYVPRLARFHAAGSELLKLLVLPLYGDKPEVGVRELVQNAVDAVRQRQFTHPTPAKPDREADIVVSINRRRPDSTVPPGWEYYIEVEDSGVGMTVSTICEHFLKVGSSFRSSAFWKSEFQDESGATKLLRIGYFGIGVLATFLLGDEIEVSTRNASSLVGVKFVARLLTDEIELLKFDRQIGTTVRAKISEGIAKRLLQTPESWNWYRLAIPSVVRINRLAAGDDVIAPAPSLPNLDAKVSFPWSKTSSQDFPAIHWTFESAPAFVCNGMFVGNHIKWTIGSFREFLHVPNVSLADPNLRLKLNLQRTMPFSGTYPFESDLLVDVVRNFIAFCFLFAPEQPFSGRNVAEYSARYPGWGPKRQILPRYVTSSMWCSSNNGVTVLHPWHLQHSGAGYCRCIVLRTGSDGFPVIPTDNNLLFWVEGVRFDEDATIRAASVFYGDLKFPGFMGIWFDNAQMLLRTETAERFDDLERINSDSKPEIDENVRMKGGEIWIHGELSSTSDFLVSLAADAAFTKGALQLASEWKLAGHQWEMYENPVGAMWEHLIGDALLPYSVLNRFKKYPKTVEQLAPHLHYWLQAASKGSVEGVSEQRGSMLAEKVRRFIK